MTITVYSKPACVQCTATYRNLEKQGSAYNAIDISEDKDAKSYVMSFGHMQAPVVVVTNDSGEVVEHWSGFRPDKIKAHAQQLINA